MAWLVTWLTVVAPALGPPPPLQQVPPSPLAETTPVTPVAEPLVLTLPAALRLGLARDRDVRIGRLDAIAARAQVTQAAAVYQPELALEAGYDRFNSASRGFATGAAGASENQEASLRVEQLLFDTAQGLFGIYRTRQEARAAELQETEIQLQVARRISTDFHDALRGQALQRLAVSLLEQAERNLEAARTRFSAGSGARLDITRAEVAVSNARVEVTSAGNDHRDALARLRYDLVLPPGTPLTVDDSWPVPAVEMGLTEAVAAARDERPAVAAARATARARRHALTAVSIARWVDLRVTGSYQMYLQSSRDTANEYLLSAALRLPLFDGQAGEARETVAIQAFQRAGEQALQEAEQAALEVEQSHLGYTDAVARLTAAEEAVRLATDSLSQTEEAYRLGVASLLELNDARTEYARAESNHIQARFDRDQAAVAFRLAIGRFPVPPELLEEPNGE